MTLTKEKKMTLFLVDDEGRRLCKDGKYRSIAFFGTLPKCVKFYKTLGRAINRAKKDNAKVCGILENDPSDKDKLELTTDGKIRHTFTSLEREGYIAHNFYKCEDYQVFPEI